MNETVMVHRSGPSQVMPDEPDWIVEHCVPEGHVAEGRIAKILWFVVKRSVQGFRRSRGDRLINQRDQRDGRAR